MASTYDNSLRLELIATGEAASTWGDKTNVNLTAIAAAFGYATQDGFAADANATTTVADGAADPARALYFKITSSATLTATRTLTIAPNTISRVMWIENATTGSQSIEISQGSGANVTIPTGKTAVVYLDGAGAGAAVVDAMASLNIDGSITAAAGTFTTADINAGTIDGTVIGGTTAAAGSFTTFTSKGIDDNATATAVTIDSANRLNIGKTASVSGAPIEFQANTSGQSVNLYGRASDGLSYLGFFANGANTEYASIRASNVSDLKLRTAGVDRLTISSTGIDVTGTVTADGLTVDGASSSQQITFSRTLSSVGTGKIGSDFDQAMGIWGTDGTKVATFYQNKDLGLYEDTGTTPKFVWNASEETLFVDQKIKVGNTTDGVVLQTSAGMGSILGVDTGGNGWNALDIRAGSATQLYLNTSGNVAIGTTTVNSKFNVASSQDALKYNEGVTVFRSTSSNKMFLNCVGGGANIVGSNSPITFNYHDQTTNNVTEAVRIVSGTLLVGKTTSDLGVTAGIELNGQYDVGYFTRSGDKALVVNRLSSDGSITDFRKDGTSVGSVGTVGGDLLVGTGDTAFRFHDGDNRIYPVNVSNGVKVDGAVDLGDPTARFKDLYLSGGVYLGGIGAANLLDDYEEGAWIPAISGGVVTTDGGNTYTKVGRLVTILMRFTVTTSSTLNLISGLPFAADTGVSKFQAAGIVITASGTGLVTARLFDNGSFIHLYDNSSGYTQHPITTSRSQYTLSFSYTTT